MYDKLLYGVGGAAATGVVTWQKFFPWIGYDLSNLRRQRHARRRITPLSTPPEEVCFMIDRFENNVDRHPDKPFIIFEDSVYTWEFVDQQANKVANVLRQRGVGLRTVVAIMMHNEPPFIWTLLGLMKLGATSAQINFNIRGRSLVHCVAASGATKIIVGNGEDLYNAIFEVANELGNAEILVQGHTATELPERFLSFSDVMDRTFPVPVTKQVRDGMKLSDLACFIYTSGTTGLPKPCNIYQWRILGWGMLLDVVHLSPQDRVYLTMPLYHSSAGGYALFSIIDVGATMVLRRKFSATMFWDDVRKYDVTLFTYIGELCRYLLNQPKNPMDGVHKLRVIYGNGLRRDIWEEFQTRFKIPEICEFFGATEGIASFFNFHKKPGAVGRLSPFMKLFDPAGRVLVRADLDSAVPARDKNGRCIEISPGEAGLFLCTIPAHLLGTKWAPYNDSKEANEKKLVRNVFCDGDLYFNYGDLLYMDKEYFLYFVDRMGDTFRWKGENVSTTEVANVLTKLDFIHDANVYGVSVPGHDGRAGMAALTLKEGSSQLTEAMLKSVYDLCQHELPSYARPLFLRKLHADVLTGTFKQQKTELMLQGFDPSRCGGDCLYMLDSEKKSYSRLDNSSLAQLSTRSRL